MHFKYNNFFFCKVLVKLYLHFVKIILLLQQLINIVQISFFKSKIDNLKIMIVLEMKAYQIINNNQLRNYGVFVRNLRNTCIT